MFQPFAELTNRTPSPAQADNDVKYRKHSPWTAARQKKKTRSVQEDKLGIQRNELPAECFNSPEVQLKTGGLTSGVQPEYSLADGLSPAAAHSSSSSHSSPPIDRGEDADIHPAKAYIVDSQDTSSPDLLAKFALAANAGAAPRSPMWFGSTALQEEILSSGVHTQASSLQHSSSAPSYVFCAQSDSIYSQKQAGACHRLAGSAISGGDKAQLTANLCADFSSSGRMGVAAWDCAQQQQQPEDTSALGAIGFQLHSRLEVASTYSQSSLLRQQAWCTRSELLQQGGGSGQHQQVSAREASQGSVEWFEEKLQEAAEEGDMATAAQLWQAMQADSILPNRKVLNNYLMCWHYGGGDPVEAEQVVREMCGAAGLEPDGTTARWLAAIDISWQQLHCGV